MFWLMFSGHHDNEGMADQFHSCKLECVAESVHIVVDQKAELTMGTSDGFNFQRPTPSDLLFTARPYILNVAQTSKSWHYLGNEHSKM